MKQLSKRIMRKINMKIAVVIFAAAKFAIVDQNQMNNLKMKKGNPQHLAHLEIRSSNKIN